MLVSCCADLNENKEIQSSSSLTDKAARPNVERTKLLQMLFGPDCWTFSFGPKQTVGCKMSAVVFFFFSFTLAHFFKQFSVSLKLKVHASQLRPRTKH